MKLFPKDNKWVPYTIAGCITVILYLLLSHVGPIFKTFGVIWNFILPVVLGAIIAYVINPLAKLCERKLFYKMKNERTAWMWSVVVALVVLILIIVLLFMALIPQVVNSIVSLVSNFDSYAASVDKFLDKISKLAAKYNLDATALETSAHNMVNNLLDSLPNRLSKLVSASKTFGSNLVTWLLGFVLAVYFLVDKPAQVRGMKRFFHAVLPQRTYDGFVRFCTRSDKILVKFISCEVIDGVIVGIVNFIFMAICGMPYNVLISVIVALTNLIPTFGPIIGTVVGGLILVLNNPWQALMFVIFTLILQTIDGYIIKPRLYGDQLGVSGVLILIAIIVGGRIFGMVGILLGIPFAAIAMFVYDEYVIPKLENRKGHHVPAEEPPESPEPPEAV